MSKSIMSNERECYYCGSPYSLEKHHVYSGSGRRKLAEKYGCWCYLCHEHHTGDTGAHFNQRLNRWLKEECQVDFEAKCGTRDEFRKIFGRSYL